MAVRGVLKYIKVSSHEDRNSKDAELHLDLQLSDFKRTVAGLTVAFAVRVRRASCTRIG